MSKTIICLGENNDYYFGNGKTPKEAYENYKKNGGDDNLDQCKFFEAEEIEIEIIIKQKTTASTAKN
jgi:hypothetical protein